MILESIHIEVAANGFIVRVSTTEEDPKPGSWGQDKTYIALTFDGVWNIVKQLTTPQEENNNGSSEGDSTEVL